MQVSLVHVQTADGLRLDGALRRPTLSAAAGRLVICHHGQGGNFYTPMFFDPVGDHLLDAGWAVIRVNSRGHDQLYTTPQGRFGSACEHVEDCPVDWRAWLDWAAPVGFGTIGLWGHSLGAVKTAYYLVTTHDPRVAWAILSSPPRWSHQAYSASADGAAFRATYEHASQLVAAGEGETLLETRVPVPGLFAARAYVEKYGPPSRYDYLHHLGSVDVPLLITIGSLEGGINYASLIRDGPRLAAQVAQLTFACIAGADHFYTGRTAALWTAISTWLNRT
jgi:pimeloyl-ACP methyl ester carboxylesterase